MIMTLLAYISIAVLIVASIAFYLIYQAQISALKELKRKTDYAVDSEVLLKIEKPRTSITAAVAENFNLLIQRVQKAFEENKELTKETADKQKMDKKLKEFEASISHIKLLTDIGMKITSSLDLESILKQIHEYISSAMEVDEVELVHGTRSARYKYNINRKGKITKEVFDPGHADTLILTWCIKNEKDVILNDAQKDYGQYVDAPIRAISGSEPGSLICVPLILHSGQNGALGIISMKKNAYNPYHLDFTRGIASYVGVALDNSNVYELLSESKAEVEIEKGKSDELLKNILPEDVAEELKQTGSAEAKKIPNVTVLFSDFENFTGISEKLSPEVLVNELNQYFKAFDEIMDKYGLEKIKTIGDAYMAAGGMNSSGDSGAKNMVMAGIEMQEFIEQQRKKNSKLNLPTFNMRVGIHTGDVVAGIVGARKFQYDIWGDTVNTASRMESSGVNGKVNISQTTHDLLKDEKDLNFTFRGEVLAKHKGAVNMYFVDKAS